MKKYIIIVSVYDQENTQAYPLGGIFDSHDDAKKYMLEHLDEVLESHWTNDREDGIGDYFEEVDTAYFEACDMSSGQSLEIEIRELPVMSKEFPVCCVTRADLEWKGFMAKDLDDNMMQNIAGTMANYIADDVGYWDALVEACEFHEIPRKEE